MDNFDKTLIICSFCILSTIIVLFWFFGSSDLDVFGVGASLAAPAIPYILIAIGTWIYKKLTSSENELEVRTSDNDIVSEEAKQRAYYLRFSAMFIDIATDVVKKVFFSLTPRREVNTFFASLNVRNKLKKYLNEKGYELVTRPNVRPDEFDISLLITLLTRLYHRQLRKPANGWKNPVDVNDFSITADLLRLREIRNKIISHRPRARLEKIKFERLWADVKCILIRLTQQVDSDNVMALKKQIDSFAIMQLDVLDSSDANYLDVIKRWFDDVQILQEKVEVLAKKCEEFDRFFKKRPAWYSRYVRLLLDGGRQALCGLLKKEIFKRGLKLEVLLPDHSVEIRDNIGDGELIEQLFPNAKGATEISLDIDKWDIAVLASVIIFILKDDMELKEEDNAVKTILDARKNYAQLALVVYDNDKCSTASGNLISSITVLCWDLDSDVKTSCKKAISNFNTAREIDYNDDDRFFEELQTHSTGIKGIVETYNATMIKLKDYVKEMENNGTPFLEYHVLDLKIVTLGNNEEKRKLVDDVLATIWQAALEKSENSPEFEKVRQCVDRILEDIRRKPEVEVGRQQQHCILFSVRCYSWSGLFQLAEYYGSSRFLQHLHYISCEMSAIYDDAIAISGNITMESFCEILNHPNVPENTDCGLKIPIKCKSVTGMKEVLKVLSDDQTTNLFNEIANQLSQSEERITLHVSSYIYGFKGVFEETDSENSGTSSIEEDEEVKKNTPDLTKVKPITFRDEDVETDSQATNTKGGLIEEETSSVEQFCVNEEPDDALSSKEFPEEDQSHITNLFDAQSEQTPDLTTMKPITVRDKNVETDSQAENTKEGIKEETSSFEQLVGNVEADDALSGKGNPEEDKKFTTDTFEDGMNSEEKPDLTTTKQVTVKDKDVETYNETTKTNAEEKQKEMLSSEQKSDNEKVDDALSSQENPEEDQNLITDTIANTSEEDPIFKIETGSDFVESNDSENNVAQNKCIQTLQKGSDELNCVEKEDHVLSENGNKVHSEETFLEKKNQKLSHEELTLLSSKFNDTNASKITYVNVKCTEVRCKDHTVSFNNPELRDLTIINSDLFVTGIHPAQLKTCEIKLTYPSNDDCSALLMSLTKARLIKRLTLESVKCTEVKQCNDGNDIVGHEHTKEVSKICEIPKLIQQNTNNNLEDCEIHGSILSHEGLVSLTSIIEHAVHLKMLKLTFVKCSRAGCDGHPIDLSENKKLHDLTLSYCDSLHVCNIDSSLESCVITGAKVSHERLSHLSTCLSLAINVTKLKLEKVGCSRTACEGHCIDLSEHKRIKNVTMQSCNYLTVEGLKGEYCLTFSGCDLSHKQWQSLSEEIKSSKVEVNFVGLCKCTDGECDGHRIDRGGKEITMTKSRKLTIFDDIFDLDKESLPEKKEIGDIVVEFE